MTVKDVIGPFAYLCWQFAGYGVFIGAGWFILFAICRAAGDARKRLSSSRPKLAGQCRLITIVRNVEGAHPTVLVLPVLINAARGKKATL